MMSKIHSYASASWGRCHASHALANGRNEYGKRLGRESPYLRTFSFTKVQQSNKSHCMILGLVKKPQLTILEITLKISGRLRARAH